MFETIIPKIIKPEEAEIKSHNFMMLKTKEPQDNAIFEMERGAGDYLYKKLGIKPATSKEVNKLSETTWKNLLQILLDYCKDDKVPFTLLDENTVYLATAQNDLVDIFQARGPEDLEEFSEKLEKYVIDVTTNEKTSKFYTDGKDGTVKLVCYDSKADLPNEEYTPVVILELNTRKSIYKVYTGILIYNEFTFIPSIEPSIDVDKFNKFIRQFDLNETLEYSKQQSEEVYSTYKQLVDNDLEISARELLQLLRVVGYKLKLKDDNQIDEIENLNDEEANAEIQDFFNTFCLTTNETAQEILSLSNLQKIFRYNKLTFMQLLKILSKEYLEFEGSKITAKVLGDIIINIFTKSTDKNQCEVIKKEIK